MKIIKSVKSGPVEIHVREYSDGRFGFDWEESGKRKQGRWRDQSDAIDAARERAKVIAAGRINLLDVDPDELAEFRAWKAARTKSKAVTDVRDELLAIKRANTGLDPHYIAQLAGPWNRFADTFGARDMTEIESEEIESWLLALKKSARTRNNIRDTIVMLFRFARKRGYLPDATTAAEKIERDKIRTLAGNIKIYTPGEMRDLLKITPTELVPWIVIGGFAGIRTEEMRPKTGSRKDPLRWEDFRWSENQIVLRAETSKTDRTRYVPLSKNIKKWLAPFKKESGPVIPLKSGTFYGAIGRLRDDTGTTGREKNNALRHSYGSYRNAIIRNIGQLAEEMGNSPGIARKNYERPQPKAVADEWFGIMP